MQKLRVKVPQKIKVIFIWCPWLVTLLGMFLARKVI